ncbi:ABC transporter permease subunit [Neofamilia massiliensis]|uniref:ABC transporter permease subunit n=1 Tax=Neofamilia massiliensis TaxID=1673724 RepID=UPI0006BB8B72|nr:ABC transporter permease subunit [Neofamilia massiliensis]
MRYEKTLIDEIGNSHPRKNLYLLDLAQASGEDFEKIKKNRDSHPYIIEYKKYKDQEKDFLSDLKKQVASFEKSSKAVKEIKALEVEFFIAEKKLDFYKPYVDLDYDAQLEYEISAHKLRHIPDIIDNHKNLSKLLKEKKEALAKIDAKEVAKKEAEIKAYKEARKADLEKEILEIKAKEKSGLISQKAYNNEVKIAKTRAKEDVLVYSYENPKKSLEEEIENINHHLKLDTKSMIKVMKSDIADTKRKIPEEIEKSSLINTIIGALVPGLGQLLNKQPVKAGLFFLGSLYIYFLAIPYFLGFGNYQGEGFYGLISLAHDGARMDRSIIFMIEGIISILLILIAIFLFVFSFVDVYRTEKKNIKGVRVNTWFETKQTLNREGFPYLVSIPAYLLIAFIVLIPIVTTLLISFTNMDPDHQNKFSWIGLSNYALIAKGEGVAGGAFWLILRWTIVWTLGATTLAIAIGFILSLLVNQDRVKGKKIFRTIYLLPWAVPAFITIMFFSLMVSRGGPLTDVINSTFNVNVDIKNSTQLTRLSLILLQGWLGSSYIFLLSTGVLQGIPKDLYEAAEIDGAKGFQQTLRITIPLVLYQTAPLLINQYTFNFNNFSIIYLFNRGGPFFPTLYGNLAGSSDLLISYIYKLTIENQYQGIGAAITIVISLVIMFVSFLGYRNTKAFKED